MSISWNINYDTSIVTNKLYDNDTSVFLIDLYANIQPTFTEFFYDVNWDVLQEIIIKKDVSILQNIKQYEIQLHKIQRKYYNKRIKEDELKVSFEQAGADLANILNKSTSYKYDFKVK